MSRTRNTIVFFLIILFAVGIIVVGQIVSNLGSDDDVVQEPIEGSEVKVPEGAIHVVVQSADTKELWMRAMAEQFNAKGVTLASGEKVFVDVQHTGSGLREDLQPVMWSPANQVWIDIINQDYRDRTNQALITETCPGTVSIPIGIAMWRPMAEALGWPTESISWQDITELALDPEGWGSKGHPEWGTLRYGHGHPEYSNSGRLSIIAEIYAATGKNKTEPLTYEDVWAEETLAAVGAVQQRVYHYGRIDTDLLDKMVVRGASYLHAVTNYEGNVIRWNQEHASELQFPLVLIYPSDGTFWMDHPMCVLDNASWVSSEQIEGAKLFRDFILERDQQAQLVSTGVRPAVQGVPLDGVNSPFTRENGVIPTITQDSVPNLPYSPEDVTRNIIDMWYQVKKPATVVIAFDVSGSMQGDPLKAAVAGAQKFISEMQLNDEIVVLAFNHNVYPLEPAGKVGEVGEQLTRTLGGLIADGGTALYQSIIKSLETVKSIEAEDLAQGEERIYSIVVMSDGENYAEDGVTESQMFSTLPDGSEADQVHIYTIAYGEQANHDLLSRVANRTNGKFYAGTIDNIADIYFQISSEF
jgi:Ca-activated chloride channel family protein